MKFLRLIVMWALCCKAYASEPEFAIQVLYDFSAGEPLTGIMLGQDGSFYGTTYFESQNDRASIFKITSKGELTTMFSAEGGSYNFAGPLIEGRRGQFFGVSSHGTGSLGFVFEFASSGRMKTLATFNGLNGSWPYGRLLLGTDGNLYGTTQWGGTRYFGTVFRVTPAGALTTLYSMAEADGAQALGGLVETEGGTMYGGTTLNGPHIFRIARNGEFTPLAALAGTNGSGFVNLMEARDGEIYGTTSQGGASYVPGGLGDQGEGTFFNLTREGQLDTLTSFSPSTGGFPNGVIEGIDGNFYGTTQGGALGPGLRHPGTIFKVTRTGELTVLATFDGTNGREPRGELVQAQDGNLYGVTRLGGKNNGGTFFRLIRTVKLSITQEGSNLILSWNSFAGANYQIQAARSLFDPWTDISNPITAST